MRCRYCRMSVVEPPRLPADVAQEFTTIIDRLHPSTVARLIWLLRRKGWRLERIQKEEPISGFH